MDPPPPVGTGAIVRSEVRGFAIMAPRPCAGRLAPVKLATAAGYSAVESVPRGNQTGRTSVTSGMKWRSRFWMPCRSVAVEDGQPEHDPFMAR